MAAIPRRKYVKYLAGLAPLVFVIGLSFYLSFAYSPNEIVGFIGVQNAYLLIFVTAILSGFMTSNVIPYHVMLVTLVAGGLNPFFAGPLAAIGVTLGDSTSYYIGYIGFRSRAILPDNMNAWLDRLYGIAIGHPLLFMLVCFFYGAAAPAPNDLVTISAGLARLPFWRVIIPLALGNVVFDMTLSLLAVYAFDILQKLSLF